MKNLPQHISALVLLAFAVMVTDAFALYPVAASDNAEYVVMAVGCHSIEMPSDWDHDEPCTPDGVQPCHICAVLIELPVGTATDATHALGYNPITSLNSVITENDPDPPKNLPL